MLYLEAGTSKTFATKPTEWITLIPTVYNADTLGIPLKQSEAPDRLLGRKLLNPVQGARRRLLSIPLDRHHGRHHVDRGDRPNTNMPTRNNMTKAEIPISP